MVDSLCMYMSITLQLFFASLHHRSRQSDTMGRPRTFAWKAADGENTVDKIYDALKPALPSLFMMVHIFYNAAEKTCTGIYTTDDMNKNIDEKCLIKWKATVTTPLLALDQRGGFFAQEDMVKAIRKHGEDEQNVTHIQASSAQMKLSEQGFVRILAYSIRCMLSHLRMVKHNRRKIKQAAIAAGNPEPACQDCPEFKELLDMLPESKCRADSQSDGSSQASMPFLSFQESNDQSDDEVIEEQTDEPEVVWKRLMDLDTIIIAIMMMSNGEKVPATKYAPGDDGFIICHWEAHKEKYETNMSNELIAENAKFINKPSPPKPQPKKAPTTPNKKKNKDAKAKSATKKKKPANTKKTMKKKPAAAELDEHPTEPPAEADNEAEVQFVAAL